MGSGRCVGEYAAGDSRGIDCEFARQIAVTRYLSFMAVWSEEGGCTGPSRGESRTFSRRGSLGMLERSTRPHSTFHSALDCDWRGFTTAVSSCLLEKVKCITLSGNVKETEEDADGPSNALAQPRLDFPFFFFSSSRSVICMTARNGRTPPVFRTGRD